MSMRCGVRFWNNCIRLIWLLKPSVFRKCAKAGGFLCAFFVIFAFDVTCFFWLQRASRLRTRPKGMKTNEVCGRPLETFVLHSHVSWFLSLLRRTKGVLTKKAAITANILRCGRRRSPEGERKALWSPPQWRNPAPHTKGVMKNHP